MFGIKDCHKPRKNTKKNYIAKKKALYTKTQRNKPKPNGLHKSRFPHVILFQSGLGQERKGVEKAPDYLRDFIGKKTMRVKDTGDLYENIVNLYRVNKDINGKRINIGGDHSMAIATIADTLNRYPEAKVIYFDAHADI